MRFIIGVLTVLLVTLGGFCWWAYRAVQRVPAFYQQARQADPKVLQAASREFVQQVEQFQKQLEQTGRWEAVFTEDQINGWLAIDAPQEFGDQLPPEIETPVVDLEPDTVWVAVRLKTDSFDTVLNLAAELDVDAETNEVSVRILEAYAGDLPIPLRTVKKRLRQATSRLRVDLRWTGADDEAVVRIKIPRWIDEQQRERVLESIEIKAGHCRLSGRTVRRTVPGK